MFNESLHSRTPELLLQMDYRLTWSDKPEDSKMVHTPNYKIAENHSIALIC